MKKIGCTLLVLLLLQAMVPSLASEYIVPVTDPGYTKSASSGDMVKVYEAPDVQSKVLREYYDEVYLMVEPYDEKWSSYAMADGTVGYILNACLVLERFASDMRYPVGAVNASALLYETPSDESESLGTCMEGTIVGVHGIAGDWLIVELGVNNGYIHADDVTVHEELGYIDFLDSDLAVMTTDFPIQTEVGGEGYDHFIPLYVMPDENSAVWIQLALDQEVKLMADLGEFSQVRAHSSIGFVRSELLKK